MTHNKASGSEGLSKLLADAADWVESVHDGEWPYHPFTRDELVERLRAASTPPLSEGAGVKGLSDEQIDNLWWRHQALDDGPSCLPDHRGFARSILAASTPSGSEGAGTKACAHSWRDFGQLGGRNVVWCAKCDALAFAGKEDAAGVKTCVEPQQEKRDA